MAGSIRGKNCAVANDRITPEPEAALWTPPSEAREPDAIEALKAVPLFSELRPRELKKVLRLLHGRTYLANEVVFREGEPGAGMFIIKRGAVDVVIRMPDGGERVLAHLGERAFFGEMALLEEAPRSATAVAKEKTELLGFFQPDLESLIERDAELGSKICWNLARLMASRIRSMNDSLRLQRAGEGSTPSAPRAAVAR